MDVREMELMLHFIELELELHRDLLDQFRVSGDEKRILAAEACIYELELLQAYAKHIVREVGVEK